MHWKLFVLCEELHWGFFFFRNKVLKRHHRMFAYLSPFCSLFLKITSYRKNSLNAIALIQILKSTTRIHKFVMNIIFQWTLYMYFELHVLRWHMMHDVPILEFNTRTIFPLTNPGSRRQSLTGFGAQFSGWSYQSLQDPVRNVISRMTLILHWLILSRCQIDLRPTK